MGLEKGQQLGPYIIEAPAGAGGMGEVYRGRDTRLNRIVAIKVLPAHSALDTNARARFEREAKTISSLNHPNICTLHDIGQHNGMDFLVMEYLEGDSLEQRLCNGALELTEALEIGVQIAAALDAAHRKGLVHRDLKPGNIILTKEGAKLLDFGLAKLHFEVVEGVSNETRSTPMTGAGTIVGTLQYMSPEQLEGHEADARSDIFALGATLYEMLSGERPFSGDSKASLIGSIMKETPRALLESSPDLPPSVDRTIRKCLAKNPDDRWQTARDLMDELRWLASGATWTETTVVAPRKSHWQTRVLQALLLIVACVSTYLFLTVDRERGTAQKAMQSLEKRQQFLSDILTSSFPRGYGDRTSVVDILDQASQMLNGAFPGEPAVEAELRMSLGRGYDRTGHTREAIRESRTGLGLAEEANGSTDSLSLTLMEDLAWYYFVSGEHSERLDILRRFAHALAERSGQNDAAVISVRMDIAGVLEQMGNLDAALEISAAVWAMAQKQPEWDSSLKLSAQLQHAWLLLRSRQFEEATKLARDAYAVTKQNHNESDSELRNARSLMAAMYIAHGDIDSAKALYGNRRVPDTYGIERVFQGDFDLSRGRYQLLVFFETWCPISKIAMGDLARVDHQYRQFGVNIFGMTRVNRTAKDEDVEPYLESLDADFTVVKENGRSWNYFNCTGTPSIRLLSSGYQIWERGSYTESAISTSMLEALVEAADQSEKDRPLGS